MDYNLVEYSLHYRASNIPDFWKKIHIKIISNTHVTFVAIMVPLGS